MSSSYMLIENTAIEAKREGQKNAGLLKYMEETTTENAVTGELKEMQAMVEQINRTGRCYLAT